MSVEFRAFRIIAAAACCVMLCVVGVWVAIRYVPPFDFVFGMSRIVAAKQRMILYGLDHAALDMMLRNFATERRWTHPLAATRSREMWFESDDAAIPPELRVLKPSLIHIDDERIDLEFGGPFLHFGVTAFRDRSKGSGTKKLRDGFWFYAENNRYPDEG